MFTNLRSIMNKNKREELERRLLDGKYDILGITESWTHEEVEDAEIALRGYKVFRRDRDKLKSEKVRGGGVLLYVKEDMNVQEVEDRNLICETIWVKLKTISGYLKIGVCYRSPTANEREIKELFENIKRNTNETAIVMGDFNYKDIDWEIMRTSGDGNDFIEMINDCFLTQHVLEPTRGDSILDLVLSTESGLVEEIKIECPVSNSDHNVVTFRIAQGIDIKKKNKGVPVYSYHKASYDKINERLNLVEWERELEDSSDIEERWEIFLNEVIQCRNDFVPKRVSRKKNYPVWMNREILRGIKKEQRMEKV